jgi:uncharacterized membrane protein YbhN (UPF0104 family)
MLLFGCIMAIPNWELVTSQRRYVVIVGFNALMFVACAALVLLAFVGGLSKGFPAARAWLRRLPRAEMLERSLASCRQLGRKPGTLAAAMMLSMALNAVCVAQVLSLAWGMGLKIPPAALFMIVPMIICISALPVTPSGLGLRENLYVVMLAASPLMIPATSALSLSLLAFAGSLVWSLVGGAVYLGVKETEHLEEVTREE